MVHILGLTEPRQVLHAYLTANLSDAELDQVHNDFELGSNAKIDPTMELFIHNVPEYHQMTHADIRRALDTQDRTEEGEEEGDEGEEEEDADDEETETELEETKDRPGEWEDVPEPEPFLIIDANTPKSRALWYVDRFADEEEVEDGVASSTDVLWELLVETKYAPERKANYEIGNGSIQEDLEICDVLVPFDPSKRPQTKPFNFDPETVEPCQTVYLVAEPAEFEESMDQRHTDEILILGRTSAHPQRVVRLKEDVAREHGIIPGWSSPSEHQDNEGKKFPKGSVTFAQSWDMDAPRQPYKRLSGSL